MTDYVELHGPDYPEDKERPRKTGSALRGFVKGVVVILIVGMFGGALTVAYNLGYEAGSRRVTPIITVNDGPIKVRPAEPGGMKIAHQDKAVYDRLTGKVETPKSERLIPAGESPAESLLLPAKPASAPAAAEASPPKPKPVPKTAATGLATSIQLPPPPPMPPKTLAAPLQKKEPAKVKVAAVPESAWTVTKKRPNLPAAAPRYDVQIASVKSAEAARRRWEQLRRAHAELFAGLTSKVRRKDLGAKKGVWYRLQAGPFADASTAKGFCRRASAKKVGCFVVRR